MPMSCFLLMVDGDFYFFFARCKFVLLPHYFGILAHQSGCNQGGFDVPTVLYSHTDECDADALRAEGGLLALFFMTDCFLVRLPMQNNKSCICEVVYVFLRLIVRHSHIMNSEGWTVLLLLCFVAAQLKDLCQSCVVRTDVGMDCKVP